ncbi:hypothetical protein HETIRDRAFT_452322 [Heterobasidion irregulare TC 32-1]|uniref:Uncharacterized protein n=1 Tax=Heterobasidion irregulare (strain TC 32-1) TaxID=747525 RepID=W4K519_HETIT|nr:uncharacterized protein HETIRDRAFT_452322 [Heterobasidion irregulare TC 32-1]ETW80834.1 hypothetical protein HETIRDRAFT_452322 [Heterobasidion irregulare TC 32-1]
MASQPQSQSQPQPSLKPARDDPAMGNDGLFRRRQDSLPRSAYVCVHWTQTGRPVTMSTEMQPSGRDPRLQRAGLRNGAELEIGAITAPLGVNVGTLKDPAGYRR